MTDEYASAIIQVGGKNLHDCAALASATTVVLMRDSYPRAQIGLWVSDYDEDPRELWDIPEVCKQIEQFVGHILSMRPYWRIEDLNLDEQSVALLGLCSKTVRIVGRNPENGNYIMEVVKDGPPPH